MTLQSSGQMTFTDIQTEFGGTNPISLDEYYGAASGIPSSGAISMNQFYGKSSAWTRTLTVGHSGGGNMTNQITGNGTGYNTVHFDEISLQPFIGSPAGSLSPNTLFDNGATIHNFHWNMQIPIKASSTLGFEFSLKGTYPNSGWNNLIMDNGMGGTVSLARTSLAYTQHPGGSGQFFQTYATTRWRINFVVGIDPDGNNRPTWFRSGTSHTFPQVTAGGPTPAVNWQEGAQINVTIS